MAGGGGHWKEYVIAPETVTRPVVGDYKSHTFVKAEHIGGVGGLAEGKPMLEALWQNIRQSTLDGQVGYYAAISDDREVVAVHYTNKDDKDVIANTFTGFGILQEFVIHRIDEYRFRQQDYNASAAALLFAN